MLNEDSQFEFALKLHLSGKLTEAEAIYRKLVQDQPNHVSALHYLGVILHQLNQTEACLAFLYRALAEDNTSADRYNDLGNILFQINDLTGAEQAFRASLKLNCLDANVWNNLASVLQRLNALSEAEKAYRQALNCDDSFVPALNNLSALLAAKGQIEESTKLACLAYIQPPYTDKSMKMLGYAFYTLGRIPEAADCYEKWLDNDPDNAFAQHHLAACRGLNAPARASNAYISSLYNEMAGHFEDKLVTRLLYRGPELIVDLLSNQLPENKSLNVLDAGCGTGLCGRVLTSYASQLIGVDISSAMLAQAQQKKIYDDLIESEITEYLLLNKQSLDLIVMADMLIYFGSLDLLFHAVRNRLRHEGYFAFTVEAVNSDQDYVLLNSGRYAHSKKYLHQLLQKLGFDILRFENVTIREEIAHPAAGFAVLARLKS